jgi:hypothetical protein
VNERKKKAAAKPKYRLSSPFRKTTPVLPNTITDIDENDEKEEEAGTYEMENCKTEENNYLKYLPVSKPRPTSSLYEASNTINLTNQETNYLKYLPVSQSRTGSSSSNFGRSTTEIQETQDNNYVKYLPDSKPRPGSASNMERNGPEVQEIQENNYVKYLPVSKAWTDPSSVLPGEGSEASSSYPTFKIHHKGSFDIQ